MEEEKKESIPRDLEESKGEKLSEMEDDDSSPNDSNIDANTCQIENKGKEEKDKTEDSIREDKWTKYKF